MHAHCTSGEGREPAEPVLIVGRGFVFPAGETSSGDTAAFSEGESVPARVEDSVLTEALDPKLLQVLDRSTALALVASERAIRDWGGIEAVPGAEIGACMGTTFGGVGTLDGFIETMRKKGPKRVHPRALQVTIGNAAVSNLSIRYSLHGATSTCSGSFLSGIHAMVHSVDSMRRGVFPPFVIAGGTESPHSRWVSRFCRVYGLENASFVEGAAAAVFQRVSGTYSREGAPYARWLGHGLFHLPPLIRRDAKTYRVRIRSFLRAVLEDTNVEPERISGAVCSCPADEILLEPLRDALTSLGIDSCDAMDAQQPRHAFAASAVKDLLRIGERVHGRPEGAGPFLFFAAAEDGDCAVILLDRPGPSTMEENT